MPNSNEYMNDYMKRRWERRRQEAIDYLGGRCVYCGKTDSLHFDHIDPSTKSFTISQGSSFSESRFWSEVDKCQLLCVGCHETKTLKDLGRVSAKTTHGTLSSYKYCRCDECSEVKRKYMREYMRNYRRK